MKCLYNFNYYILSKTSIFLFNKFNHQIIYENINNKIKIKLKY